MQTMFDTLDQIEQNIRLVGYMTGQDESAEKEAARFHAAIEKAASLRPPSAAKPRILGLGGTYSYGKKTLFQDIVTRLGGINVGAENGLLGYDAVNYEQIIRWDPEWIIAGAKGGSEKQVLAKLMSDPAIALTQAARNGHIVAVDNRVFLPMSPYTSTFVQLIAEAIYGSPSDKRETSFECHCSKQSAAECTPVATSSADLLCVSFAYPFHLLAGCCGNWEHAHFLVDHSQGGRIKTAAAFMEWFASGYEGG